MLTGEQLEGLYRLLTAADPDQPAVIAGVHGTLELATRDLAAMVGALLQVQAMALQDAQTDAGLQRMSRRLADAYPEAWAELQAMRASRNVHLVELEAPLPPSPGPSPHDKD